MDSWRQTPPTIQSSVSSNVFWGMSAVASGGWYSETDRKRALKKRAHPSRANPRRSRYSVAAPCTLTAGASDRKAVASGGWYSETDRKRALKKRAPPSRANPRRSRYSVAAPCTLTAGASGIVVAAASPPCALPAAGRLGAAFARPAAFRGAIRWLWTLGDACPGSALQAQFGRRPRRFLPYG